jgi:hypothetical protein
VEKTHSLVIMICTIRQIKWMNLRNVGCIILIFYNFRKHTKFSTVASLDYYTWNFLFHPKSSQCQVINQAPSNFSVIFTEFFRNSIVELSNKIIVINGVGEKGDWQKGRQDALSHKRILVQNFAYHQSEPYILLRCASYSLLYVLNFKIRNKSYKKESIPQQKFSILFRE